MNTPTPQELASIRGQLDTLATRYKSDQAFATQLKADPEGTLKTAGIPAAAIPDVLREEGLGSEVQGYAECWISCLLTSKCNFTVG